MRTFVVIGISSLIFANGCATSGPLASIARKPVEIVRADSDRLSDLESATHQRDTNTSKNKSSASKCKTCGKDPCTCGRSSSDLSIGNELIGQIMFGIIGSPFIIPALLLNDHYDHYTEFPEHPYADDVPGSLLIDSELKTKTQTWTGNLQAFVVPGTDNVDRIGGRLVLDSQIRLGIDTEANYWTSFHSNTNTNHAWIGDANVVFRFAESDHIQMRAGLGVNWLSDQTHPEAGVNFTYGIEWFPVKPWTVSSVIDCGTLGGGSLFHNRTTVGVMLGSTEAFVGYDYFQVQSVNVQGPVAGIGWRF